MPSLSAVISVLEQKYPPETAEKWDAVGLSCGDPQQQVSRMVLAVDCVPATMQQARAEGAQLLLTHHPLLLTGVHGVPTTDPKGSLIHQMIRSGIAHYVAHTNADVALGGVSEALAVTLGLSGLAPLLPAADGLIGSGRIGLLEQPCTLREFTDTVARALPGTVAGVRAAGHPDQRVHRVAVCGGSGAAFADLARSLRADAFVTADLKHHNALEIVTERCVDDDPERAPMALIDAAHWATERPWLRSVAAVLREQFGADLAIVESNVVTDPWVLHAH